MKITTINVKWTENHHCDDGVVVEASMTVTAELDDGEANNDPFDLIQEELFDLARTGVSRQIEDALNTHSHSWKANQNQAAQANGADVYTDGWPVIN